MGRIKSKMIKKAAKQLYEEIEGFNENFDHNKALLKGTMPYKSMRNKVAGGIVRLATNEMKKKKRVVKRDADRSSDNPSEGQSEESRAAR